MARALLVLAGVLGAGCSSDPVVRQELPEIAPPAVVDGPVKARRNEDICEGLVAAVQAWEGAFAALRRQASGPGRWQARPLDQELDQCVVDGSVRISASYVCTVAVAGSGDRRSAEVVFRRVEDRIDRCLAQPLWYPRQWAKAHPVELAGGEGQQLWRDLQAWPRPALQLKLEEDYARPGRWSVRFTTYTMR